MSHALPPKCQPPLRAALAELHELLPAVQVPASPDKPDVAQEALIAHISSCADAVNHEATKASAVLMLKGVTPEHWCVCVPRRV